MIRFCLLAMLCACSTVCLPQFKVVTIGSSTTFGQGASTPDSSWVGRFTRYYKTELGIVDKVINLGQSGFTVYAAMPTGYSSPPGRPGTTPWANVSKAIDTLKKLGVVDFTNTVIIVNYPTNGFPDYTVAEVMKCFRVIYDSATRLGSKCFITTTQPRSSAAGGFNTPAAKKELADIKDSILLQFSGHTLNFWDGMFNPADTTIKAIYHSGDSTHFNNAGHRILFQQVAATNVLGLSLPIKLHTFNATLKDKKVELKWSAEEEAPNAAFIVQRSENGQDFESLKQIAANTTAGQHQYAFTDQSPLPGTDHYRLAIVERGHTSYSKIITVKTEQTGWVLKKLYPVPADKLLQLEIVAAKAQPVTIDIVNGSGVAVQKYNRSMIAGNNRFNLPIQQLPGGVYFVRINAGNETPIIRSFTK
jgi:lysophospholipase L1-like esterase